MHGFIFFKLKKYIENTFDSSTWRKILRTSGIGYKLYWPANMYPDEEMVALLKASAQTMNTSRAKMLKNFGLFLAPGLIEMYVDLINPKWKTLDLLEHTEDSMHAAVRSKNLQAKPPQLDIERVNNGKVKINYYSSRKLCNLLKGIAHGIAEYYNEKIEIHETSCMHQGDSSCTVFIEQPKKVDH